jgi:hypothetical protein
VKKENTWKNYIEKMNKVIAKWKCKSI